MTLDDTSALLRLIACGGPTAPRRSLLEHTAAPAAAWAAGTGTWRACGLTAEQAGALRGPAPAELTAARRWLEAPDHHLIGWHDPDYPSLLRRGANPPLALFIAGDPMRLWHPSVAVVGSRAPTPGGRDNAARFARALASAGWAVASGLAAGIDTAAHVATLDAGGLTLAVLGTGPDVPYPRGNTVLLARVAAEGAVVSEYLPGTRPRKEHFPERNRILAGLSLGTLVVEAATRSGALITARLAAEAGREVYALPGSIHNPMARGCHRLIRDGAALVEDVSELVAGLAPLAAELAGDLRQRLRAPTSSGHTGVTDAVHDADRALMHDVLKQSCDSPDHNKLWKALGHDPTGMDQLVERSGLTAAQVSSMLLLMELDGRVTAQHGRYFRSH
jgi:DNA processing protein